MNRVNHTQLTERIRLFEEYIRQVKGHTHNDHGSYDASTLIWERLQQQREVIREELCTGIDDVGTMATIMDMAIDIIMIGSCQGITDTLRQTWHTWARICHATGMSLTNTIDLLMTIRRHLMSAAMREVVQEHGHGMAEILRLEETCDVFCRDISEFFWESLRRAERALQALSLCNEALAQTNDEDDLLDKVCRIVVEKGGYMMAWVGYAETGALKRVRPVAHAGTGTDYLDHVELRWDETTVGLGPVGTTIRTRTPYIVTNVMTDERFELWRDLACRYGFGSLASFPLQHEGNLLGALVVYAAETDAFDCEEMILLGRLADNLAYGIMGLRSRLEQRRAEEKLHALVAAIRDVILVVDREGRYLDIATAQSALLYRPADEILGKRLDEVFSQEQAEIFLHAIRHVLDTRQSQSLDYVLEIDGHDVWFTATISPLSEETVLCVARDITDRKRLETELEQRVEERTEMLQHAVSQALSQLILREEVEQALRRRDAILESVGVAAGRLLSTNDVQQHIQLLIEQIGQATGVDRVYVFENGRDAAGQLMASQRYEWVAEGNQHYLSCPERQQMPYRQMGFQRWEERLGAGEAIYGPLSSFPEQERALLAYYGVCSIAIVPLLVSRKWWGFIGLSDTQNAREWSDAEIDAIWVAAGLIGSAMQRVQSERALARSQEEIRKLLRVVEQTSNSIVITDTNGIIEYINPAFTKITGYSADEVIGERLSILQSGETAQAVYEHLWQTIQQGEEWRGDFYNRRKNGELYWESTSITPIVDEQGEITHFLAMKEDITERKAVEEELRRAKGLAEAATRAKSSFLANMSHEIRTPMNAVIGMTELLLDTPLSSEQADYVETIRLSGETLLSLINDILDFSKIEAGKLDLEHAPFSLRKCLEDALDMVATRAFQKGLELIFFVDARLPDMVVGDSMRLRQIILNLLSNGVKFTATGHVGIWATGHALCGEDGRLWCHVLLSVEDTGIGIPAERCEHLFQSFTQADVSMSRQYGGSGLGLAISKRLAELMGGEMIVESEEGAGATFQMRLLLEVERPSAFQQRIGWRAWHAPSWLAGKRVLLVEGNESARSLLIHYLTMWGIYPLVVATAEEALQIAMERCDCDALLLSDHAGDVVNGVLLTETLQTMRRARNMATIPVLLLSTITHRHIVEPYASDSGVWVLLKPVTPEMLYGAWFEVFGGGVEQPPIHERLTKWDIADGVVIEEREDRGKLRLLLAEDNLVNQKVAMRLLEKLGYHADIAGNGREVLAALEHTPYDIVLMDIQMPEMDGVEATRRIRQMPSKEQPKIVAMTAHALYGDREWLLDIGMDGYLSKPVRLDELERVLHQVGRTIGNRAVLEIEDEHVVPNPDVAIVAIDQEIFHEFLVMVGGHEDPEIAKEFLELFLDEAENYIVTMQRAAERCDWKQVVMIAHTLKSISAQVGALPLSLACRAIESSLGGKEIAHEDDIGCMVTKTKRLYYNVRESLERLLARK